MKRCLTLVAGCMVVLWGQQSTGAPARTPGVISTRPAGKVTLAQSVRLHAGSVLDQLQSDGDFGKTRRALGDLFDQVIAIGPAKDLDAFREAAFALRLVSQLERTSATGRTELLKYLRENANLARTLAFLIQPKDKPAEVYALLDRLRRERGRVLDAYATLTAAICVVHDHPLDRRVNENAAKADDPLKIFDYYCRNEGRMFFKIKPVPAELLIYVVDTTASIEEMEWALERYAGDPKVGGRFFDIKYDHEHVRRGTPKQVTREGFNLPNILQFGGVCADQAYFASSVGKAIGVPTALASGSAGEMGHAWVGFFQATGRQGWWNFDIGRYAAYRGIRGVVIDPQLREGIPDSYVALLAEMIGSNPESRHAAVALTDAAMRLIELERSGKALGAPITDERIAGTVLAKPRKAEAAAELELLEAAVKQCPGNRSCWFVVRDLAKGGKLSLDQKRRWAAALEQMCGTKYPDFAVAVLTPMIQTVEEVAEQEKLWNEAFNRFSGRADLAAALRMSQAAMWESKGQTERAGICYMDVIERYANAGPFVIEALQKAEKALVTVGRRDRVVSLYEQTWGRIDRPRDLFFGTFVTQSNWYRVGQMFATKLEETGAGQQAAVVRAELEGRTGVVAPGR
ncbi:MAG: hypothetical protein NTU53_04130 [Planctomycetota bacterium]|nr:hypothetical protein [Planctomycetota bacterium]